MGGKEDKGLKTTERIRSREDRTSARAGFFEVSFETDVLKLFEELNGAGDAAVVAF